ncbi:Uncharacterised protein [Alistipes sp. cv1]|nr:Uncharacterised protein [Faecalibacterium prausnitzii]
MTFLSPANSLRSLSFLTEGPGAAWNSSGLSTLSTTASGDTTGMPCCAANAATGGKHSS